MYCIFIITTTRMPNPVSFLPFIIYDPKLYCIPLGHTFSLSVTYFIVSLKTGVLISPQPDQEGNKLGSMSGTRAISTTTRRELSSNSFPVRQGAEGNSHLFGLRTCQHPCNSTIKKLFIGLFNKAFQLNRLPNDELQ